MIRFSFFLKAGVVFFALGVTACSSGSVVSDSSQSNKPAATANQQPGSQTAPPVASTATTATSPTPSPTMPPAMKEAMAKPGVPVTVPESMRRPLTPEEMKKAMEQMPPEVRARIQGLGAAPAASPKKP